VTVIYSEIQIDPDPNDPNGVAFFISQDEQGNVLLSDSEGNSLHAMPVKVLGEMVARVGDLDMPVDIVVPVDDEEVPF